MGPILSVVVVVVVWALFAARTPCFSPPTRIAPGSEGLNPTPHANRWKGGRNHRANGTTSHRRPNGRSKRKHRARKTTETKTKTEKTRIGSNVRLPRRSGRQKRRRRTQPGSAPTMAPNSKIPRGHPPIRTKRSTAAQSGARMFRREHRVGLPRAGIGGRRSVTLYREAPTRSRIARRKRGRFLPNFVRIEMITAESRTHATIPPEAATNQEVRIAAVSRYIAQILFTPRRTDAPVAISVISTSHFRMPRIHRPRRCFGSPFRSAKWHTAR